jgi:hypothetical protein
MQVANFLDFVAVYGDVHGLAEQDISYGHGLFFLIGPGE